LRARQSHLWSIILLIHGLGCGHGPAALPTESGTGDGMVVACLSNCRTFGHVCASVSRAATEEKCELRYMSLCIDDCKIANGGSDERCAACIDRSTKDCRQFGAGQLQLCRREMLACQSRCRAQAGSSRDRRQGVDSDMADPAFGSPCGERLRPPGVSAEATPGWNGMSCISTTCPPGLHFENALGCVYPDGNLCPGGCGTYVSVDGGGPFGKTPLDLVAIADVLDGVAVTECKLEGGPTGRGHVTVTVLPNGGIAAVDVDAPPFSGTSVGECVARQYKRVRVPKYVGPVTRVGKSFSLR
jgi:hypothetical protein